MKWLCIGEPKMDSPTPKGFRVALQSDITKRKGICCRNLKELKKKICDKFPGIIENSEKLKVFSEDGTEIDDEEYFQSLADNTRLMLLYTQDIWSPVGPPYLFAESRSFFIRQGKRISFFLFPLLLL